MKDANALDRGLWRGLAGIGIFAALLREASSICCAEYCNSKLGEIGGS